MKKLTMRIAVFIIAILTSLPALAGDKDVPDEFFTKLFASAKFASDPMFAVLTAGLVCAIFALWPWGKESKAFGALIGGLLLACVVALICPMLEVPMTGVGILAAIMGIGSLAAMDGFKGVSLKTLFSSKGDKDDDDEGKGGKRSSLKYCHVCEEKTRGTRFCLECRTPRRRNRNRDDDEPPPRRRTRRRNPRDDDTPPPRRRTRRQTPPDPRPPPPAPANVLDID